MECIDESGRFSRIFFLRAAFSDRGLKVSGSGFPSVLLEESNCFVEYLGKKNNDEQSDNGVDGLLPGFHHVGTGCGGVVAEEDGAEELEAAGGKGKNGKGNGNAASDFIDFVCVGVCVVGTG